MKGKKNKIKLKFTTVALTENQHLEKLLSSDVLTVFCYGYENDKRKKSLDGYYFRSEVFIKGLLKNT